MHLCVCLYCLESESCIAFIYFLNFFGNKTSMLRASFATKGVGVVPLLADFNCSGSTNWEFQCQASLTKIVLHNNK